MFSEKSLEWSYGDTERVMTQDLWTSAILTPLRAQTVREPRARCLMAKDGDTLIIVHWNLNMSAEASQSVKRKKNIRLADWIVKVKQTSEQDVYYIACSDDNAEVSHFLLWFGCENDWIMIDCWLILLITWEPKCLTR